MQKITLYVCSCCGVKSENYSEILSCECSHLGITVQQLNKWKELQKKVRNASYTYSVRHNESTGKDLDDAVNELNKFEKAYDLIDKNIPDLC